MANRYFKQFVRTPDTNVTLLDGYVNVGATGAVVSSTVPFGTVTRTGSGAYTLTLQDTYPSLLFAGASPVNNTAQNVDWCCTTFDVSGAGTISFTCNNQSTGTATDPTSGNGFFISVILKNSGLGVGQ